jgi:hypothetical protein
MSKDHLDILIFLVLFIRFLKQTKYVGKFIINLIIYIALTQGKLYIHKVNCFLVILLGKILQSLDNYLEIILRNLCRIFQESIINIYSNLSTKISLRISEFAKSIVIDNLYYIIQRFIYHSLLK